MSVDMETNISIAGRKGVLSQEMTHPFFPIVHIGAITEARLRDTRVLRRRTETHERLIEALNREREALNRKREAHSREMRSILKQLEVSLKEQLRKTQEDAERIKKETEIICQTPHLHPQAVDAADFIENMTTEIMEQKQTLQQRNTVLEKTSCVKKENTQSVTSVKESCGNVKIYLTQVTGLVQDKICSLPENVKKKLESLMTSFQRLLAGIWRLLYIILLLHELEKLIVCLSFEGAHNCRRKGRLKYGFEMASMFALWLSHDVESNPGPSYDNRMSLEWLLRQLSEALKQHLKIKGSLWSTQVAEAAYRAGFPKEFYWNNPSGKNRSGKKDTTETLIKKAEELGHLLKRKNCLSTDLAGLLSDLSGERSKDDLRIQCKTEHLRTLVGALLSEKLSPFQKAKIYQVLEPMNKVTGNCDQLHVHASIRSMSSGRDFGQLADTMSTQNDLKGNTSSSLDGKVNLDQGIIMEGNSSNEDSNILPGDGQALDDFRNTNEAGSGQLSNQFVQPLAEQTGADDNENDLPDVSLIDGYLQGTIKSLDTESECHTADTLQRDTDEISETNSNIRKSHTNTNTETALTDFKDANNTALADYGDSQTTEMTDTGENLITGAVGVEQIGESEDLSGDNDFAIHETSTVLEDPEMQLEIPEVTQVITSESTYSHGNHILLIEENTPETNIHLMLNYDEQTKQNLQPVAQVTNVHDSSRKDGHQVDEEQVTEPRTCTPVEGGLTEPAPASKNDGESHQQTSLGIGASLMEQLQRLKQNFDDHLQNITRCVVDLNTQTSSPKAPRMNNLQSDNIGNDGSHHEYTAEEMGRGQRQMYPSGSDVEAEMLDDTHVQTSHCDHLEATSTADQHEQVGESSVVSSGTDGCTWRGRTKRKKKSWICSSKRRRH